ncbi:MAG: hypothetical protein EOO03_00905 [Chitinophagaceae bacterium]|nr:MAG: hypothetical protein EOO03_00905 [Chitinophagaceae bacterium]
MKSTTALLKSSVSLFSALFITSVAFSQENSPYSRYGVGDIVPNQNVVSRGMGGLSAGYADFQSLNFVNPASLGGVSNTIFDLGADIDIRNLKSNTSPQKFQSVNTLISYLQIGFPVGSEKMMKKKNFWGVSFGLRPVSRINYKIQSGERTAVDSLSTIYEGSGGISQANISTGIKLKNFSLGVSTGYTFGSKDYSTQREIANDSVFHYPSNTAVKTRFGGVFVNTGMQYDILSKDKKRMLRLGAYANLQQNLNAKRTEIQETISYDGNGGFDNVDTVSFTKDVEGVVKLPATYGFGFTYVERNLVLGADLELSNWSDYRYYGQPESLQNSYTIRVGAQYHPAKDNTPPSKYWSFVKYRAGFYYGNDYVKINDQNKPNYGLTLGAGLPLTSLARTAYAREVVVLNTGLEIGARGDKKSQSLRENIVRFSIGVSMNARWFFKPKYD